MKKKMFRGFCIISAGAALMAVLLSTWVFWDVYSSRVQTDLREQCAVIAFSASREEDMMSYLSALPGQTSENRVTLIAPDGTVLLDTRGAAATMENHADRPEVIDAIDKGQGESVRRSPTLGEATYYCARRLSDGNILRISVRRNSVAALLGVVILPLILVFLLLWGISMWAASYYTRYMLKPVEKIGRELENNTENLPEDYYEELTPFVTTIRRQKSELRRQMEKLRQERDTIADITGNMQEGLVLIDAQKNILSVNPAALDLFDAGHWNYTGNNILCLSRDPRLKEGVDGALEGKDYSSIIQCGGRICRMMMSPVLRNQVINGVILFIMDVTQEQKSEQMRREFSANVSHELKTPLTAISGYAEVIQTGMAQSTEDVKNFAGRITAEASRLLGLIDDIIRLSSLDEHHEMPKDEADLLALCSSVAEGLATAAQKRQVTISVTGESFSVLTVPSLLRELVANLVDNAVKYNKEGGSVAISVEKQDNKAILRVTDTGIGIPQEAWARVFERFYRVDKSRSKQTGGTGLGLSIVKHIAEQLGGVVRLESTLGKGSTFIVELPLSQ